MIIDRPEGNKLTGLYRGKVIQHLPHGKLKVFIPSVYPDFCEVDPSTLPDAEQLTPIFAGSSQGNGIFSYPNIGSIVMCQFINGDQNYPLVIGATLGGSNAFGQYSHIFDNKLSGKIALSTDINKVNHSSPSHLITAGKTHLRLFEDGRISAITVTPNITSVDVDFQNKQLCSDFLSSKVNSQFVMSNRGELSASTNNMIHNIVSEYKSNINGNICINTQSPEISCYIDMVSQGSINIETIKKSGEYSKINLQATGNVIIDSDTTIQLHAKNISLSADTQLTMAAPNCNIQTTTAFSTESPSIWLNSSAGATYITAAKSNQIVV